MSTMEQRVRTCLWYDGRGRQAAEFYVSLLPGSRIESVDGIVTTFSLAGVPYMALDGGPHFTLSPAASISVSTTDQQETDRLWNALLADGGQESMCGWLVDRFGLSWQIVPEVLPRLLRSDDRAAARRVQEAMLNMRKLEIADLEAAHRGESAG